MIRQMLHALDRRWVGPSLRVVIDGEAYRLGAANARLAAEVIVHDRRVLRRMMFSPSLAFGEGYTEGEIEVRGPLMPLLEASYRNGENLHHGPLARLFMAMCRLPVFTSRHRAVANAQCHYDRGNDFYKLWLDPTMTYSCAYFRGEEDDIATAQQNKLELLCRKARLRPGQSLLDIGCGWGGLVFHAAERFGVHATGITPAKEQADHIEAEAERRGIADRVHVIRGEWRELAGRYDRILSVGMFEHVGRAQYRAFFRKWQQLLKPDGLSVLHSIGRMRPEATDPWIRKHIFPGGDLPTIKQIVDRLEQTPLNIADVENLAQHYARTLAAWSANYRDAWDKVVAMFDERFARMWWLYLQSSESAFRFGGLMLWQVVIAGPENHDWPLNRDIWTHEAAAEPWVSSSDPVQNPMSQRASSVSQPVG